MNNRHNAAEPELPMKPHRVKACLEGDATEEELGVMKRWMEESESNRCAMEELTKLYHAKRSADRMRSRNALAAYDNIAKQIHPKEPKRVKALYPYIAASLIGAVAMFSLIYVVSPQKVYKVSRMVVQTNPGVRTQVSLPDGSQVELNSGSKISYSSDFGTTHRSVTLSGEGLFSVKKDNNVPFIVQSVSQRNAVYVYGTTFNVQSFDKSNLFTTTLVEGDVDVAVTLANDSIDVRHLKPHQKLSFFTNSNLVTVSSTDAHEEIAWTKGRIVFRKEPLERVLNRLVYYYNVEFEVKDRAIYDYEFTGTFSHKQLEQILNYLKISSHIDYTIQHPSADDRREVKRTRVILNL